MFQEQCHKLFKLFQSRTQSIGAWCVKGPFGSRVYFIVSYVHASLVIRRFWFWTVCTVETSLPRRDDQILFFSENRKPNKTEEVLVDFLLQRLEEAEDYAESLLMTQ